MKRLVAGFGIAIGIAFPSLGSVAAHGVPESVPNNSVGIAMASAHTSDTDASIKVNFEDLIISKKQPPASGEN